MTTVPLAGPIEGSALSLESRSLEPGAELRVADTSGDSLFYVAAGDGTIALGDGTQSLAAGGAALVLAGEEAAVRAGATGLELVHVAVGPDADRHAPLGSRDLVVPPEATDTERATGARSFRILLGPHNGSTRATLFAGFIPPGKAPWHYHLYDEIVFVPEGPARLHVGETTEELAARSAFRLRPREVHIVENTSSVRELTVIGIFTPAGSPSAAYLASDVVAASPFVG